MDKEQFKQQIEPLIKYNARSDRWQLTEEKRSCEHCDSLVANRRVECAAYRLGTPQAHFKHVCKPCNFILFDGSRTKSPRQRPIEQYKPRNNGRGRQVRTPDGDFPSLKDMAAHYNKNPSTILYWLQTKPHLYYYI